jgi:hypothetical protein
VGGLEEVIVFFIKKAWRNVYNRGGGESKGGIIENLCGMEG